MNIRAEILEMVDRDLQLREKLAREGVLSEDYHPQMEAIHNQNADRLKSILDQFGWPTVDLVGADAAEAAWLIVQHAISKPDFQRRCLEILSTNYDWDTNGS